MKNIEIAIADDEMLFRKGMKLILNDYEGLHVCLEAENGRDLLDKISNVENLPDVLLLDLKMPILSGVEAAKELQVSFSEVKIIVLSTHFSRAFVINMMELSAVAYLPKNSDPETVVETIRSVHSKGFHYSDEVMAIIHENMMSKNKPKMEFSVDISRREREVLQLICEQYTAPEIAEKLFISPRTVDGHRNNLLVKTGCKNVAGLVVFALQNGLVDISMKY